MDWSAVFENPIFTGLAGVVLTGLAALIKRAFDIAHKHLELEALKVTTQIEIVSQQRKRLTGTATPTSTKLIHAVEGLQRTRPTLSTQAARQLVEGVLPHTREVVKAVDAKVSQIPRRPGSSGEHVILIPENPMPDLPRPSGEHDVEIEFDLPRDPATIDDGGKR